MHPDMLKRKEEKKEINWIHLDPIERSRTYHFSENRTLKIFNVAKMQLLGDRNTHRLETTDGYKFIVRNWDYIEIDVKEWTF